MHSKHRRQFIAASSLGLATMPGIVRGANAAPTYPARPIQLIVPFSQGGSTDIVARIIAPAMAQVMGQPVLVNNIGGAGGTVGAQALADAQPDGYTLGMATVSTTGTGPIVRQSIRYDPLLDFAPVVKLVDVPGVISVHPSFPARNYRDFVQTIRAQPGRFTYASSGLGGVQHMGMELFKIRNRIYLLHMPFKGAGPALRDVVAGRIEVMWDNLSSSLPHIKAGRLRPIGLVGGQRSEQLPKLPTFGELGLRNYDAATYFGVLAPARTSQHIVHTLNRVLNLILQDPPIRQALINAGGVPVGGPPSVLQHQILAELRKWGEVARYAKVLV